MFANVLTEANHTMAEMRKPSSPEDKAKMMQDLTSFFEYLIVLLVFVFIFMLWSDYMATWTDYEENIPDYERRRVGQAEDYEEWLQCQEELANEHTPLIRRQLYDGPLSPNEVLRLSAMLNDETDEKLLRSLKEVPHSQEEVARLTKIIRDTAEAQTDYGSIVSSRKRKAAEGSDDEFGDEKMEKPCQRRLKVETGADENARWVCKEFTRSPSFMSGLDPSSSGYSADREVSFTFEAPFPGRAVKSPVKY
ncbi:MAG: hypothetical protein Q9169_002824 [Polycauliona sp. 2 TL-2023]